MAFTDWVADEQEEIETDIEVTDEVTEEVEETEVEATEEHIEEVVEQEAPAPQTFNINGQDLTIDEIQTGYMRQQDYLAKQQEIEALRVENQKALELVEYIKKNPHLAQRLMDEEGVDQEVASVTNPLTQRLEALERERYVEKVNNQISQLKAKYPDFNEVEVLNRAVNMKVQDLEFVYHGMRGANMEDVIAQKVREQLAKATEDMAKNTEATRTVIGSAKQTDVEEKHSLTAQQMRVADLMGIGYEDYAKYL